MKYKILKIDPYLTPYEKDIAQRMTHFTETRSSLLENDGDLVSFANSHLYFGIHKTADGWVYREWAPAAEAMYFTGDFNGWNLTSHPMTACENGVFEIILPYDALAVGQKVQAIIQHNGALLRRIPTHATRVVQDPVTYLWCAEIDDALWENFDWSDSNFKPARRPLIYECHIGMAGETGEVSNYPHFTRHILPRVKKLGYNTVQIMAVMEHPYYGSFGYQVSNFFAPSSRYGTAHELKELINTAHKMGITVLLDVVHSHAVSNTEEGLAQFDGTPYQFFHEGAKGNHPAWGTKLFNYGKHGVLHFLLSNLKYWMEIFHFDGFRFDGVTSMLYHDHGLGSAFTDYGMYFSPNTDLEAITYLQLANELIHTINPYALTVAEDMSGMPGMCLPIKDGGIGFDYRLSMGVPDLWIKWLKERADQDWDMGALWHELTQRRPMEKTVGYCESHDQALVGDKTIMFRLCDAEMYTHMNKESESAVIDRGMALHKMIRFVTSTLAGEGYLNFMGNEFGHPEWIDFPREGNGWSYHYCRRQWSLSDNDLLRYGQLGAFDRAMVSLLRRERLLFKTAKLLWFNNEHNLMVYQKGDVVFAFNFHPTRSEEKLWIPTNTPSVYDVVLSTDDGTFGGFDRVDTRYRYHTECHNGDNGFYLYLPARTAIALKKG